MDPKRYVERILEDEGIAGGIADEEAERLLVWACRRLEQQVTDATDDLQAQQCTKIIAARARSLAKVVEKLCYDEDVTAAQQTWEALGHSHHLSPLAGLEPVCVMDQLLTWEDALEG